MSAELDYTYDAHGNKRPLGHIPEDDLGLMKFAPTWAAAGNDLIPESEWYDYYEFPDGEIPIKNQNGYGACDGHAGASGVELSRYVANMPFVGLSAWWVYGWMGGGWDRGASIGPTLDLVETKGVAPEKLMPWGKFDPNRFTQAQADEAKRYRAEIGNALSSYEELGTAVMRREVVNAAVWGGSKWDSSFARLDGEGVPDKLGRDTNHAITIGLGMKFSKVWGWCGLCTNSWDVTYGIKGHCWLPLKVIVQARGFDAYTVRAVKDDPQDKTRPILV